MKILASLIACISAVISVAAGAATDLNSQEVFLAPGWGQLSFEAPAPGSYELPVIGGAADGNVVTSTRAKTTLADIKGGRISLLSFIYRTCDDVNGCPLSTMVLYTLGQELAKTPELAERLQIMTLSFDPQFDTPEVMADYKDSILGDVPMNWAFLTTESETQLQPILDAYQQNVVRDRNSAPGEPAKFSHILRVYLVDADNQIRNIYSLSFLHPDILINDVKTLILEEQAESMDN